MLLFGISDTTKVLALERAEKPDGETGTLLREWSRKLTGEALGTGTLPRLEAFYKIRPRAALSILCLGND